MENHAYVRSPVEIQRTWLRFRCQGMDGHRGGDRDRPADITGAALVLLRRATLSLVDKQTAVFRRQLRSACTTSVVQFRKL